MDNTQLLGEEHMHYGGVCVCEFSGRTIERWTHRLSQGHHLTCIVCVCVLGSVAVRGRKSN